MLEASTLCLERFPGPIAAARLGTSLAAQSVPRYSVFDMRDGSSRVEMSVGIDSM